MIGEQTAEIGKMDARLLLITTSEHTGILYHGVHDIFRRP